MRNILIFSLFILCFTSTTFAAPFSPTILRLSAPENISYEFDGTTINIPVTVSGTPACAIFLIYTKDKVEA